MASFLAPKYFAMETATLMPRALKLCVGLSDSSLIQRLTSSANFFARSSGVPPSPNETGSTSAGSGNSSRYRHNDFTRARNASRVSVAPAFVRSTTANSGFWQAVQRFCRRDDPWRSPHEEHSRWDTNITQRKAVFWEAHVLSRNLSALIRIRIFRHTTRATSRPPGHVRVIGDQRIGLSWHWGLSRQDRQFQLLRVSNNKQLCREADLFADEYFVQVVNCTDRSLVECYDQITLPQTSAFCRAPFFYGHNQHARFER